MSEPMPGEVPAQQYRDVRDAEEAGDAADAVPARFPGSREFPAPAQQHAGPSEPADFSLHTAPPAPAGDGSGPPGEAGPARPVEGQATGEAADGPPSEALEAEEHGPGEEDDGPRPLGLHVEPTGHAPVDAQLRRLEDADHLAVSGHTEVYEDVHRGLRDTLTALDRPAPGPVPGHASGTVPGRGVPGRPYPRS